MKLDMKILLVALSIFVQALFPVGFMPSFADDGVTIEICSGAEIRTIPIEGDDTHNDMEQCPYFGTVAFVPVKAQNFAALQTPFILTNWSVSDDLFIDHSVVSNLTRGPPIVFLS